jgi:hypothetical protein
MKRAIALALLLHLVVVNACSAKKANATDLLYFGAKVLSIDPHDPQAGELVKQLRNEVDRAKAETGSESLKDVLNLYGTAVETFQSSIQRLNAEKGSGPQVAPTDDSQSSVGLWNKAKEQLRTAQDSYLHFKGWRKFEPIYLDPPMRSKRPPSWRR